MRQRHTTGDILYVIMGSGEEITGEGFHPIAMMTAGIRKSRADG